MRTIVYQDEKLNISKLDTIDDINTLEDLPPYQLFSQEFYDEKKENTFYVIDEGKTKPQGLRYTFFYQVPQTKELYFLSFHNEPMSEMEFEDLFLWVLTKEELDFIDELGDWRNN